MEFFVIASFVISLFSVYWMIQTLKLIKETRIINSMTLKTILAYCKSKGVEIDIEKIQKEVEENV